MGVGGSRTPHLGLATCFHYDEGECHGRGNFERVVKVLVWSLTALSDGVFPHADHNGRPFSLEYYPKRAKLAGKQLANGLMR